MHMEAVGDEPFSDAVLACLSPTPWSISAEEIARRRDLRSVRCTTILICSKFARYGLITAGRTCIAVASAIPHNPRQTADEWHFFCGSKPVSARAAL